MSPNNGKSAIHETDESAETKPTFRLTSLPPEIISLIFSFTKEHPQQHIYRYIQVSKFFYTELIGTLYGRLNLNKDNVQKIFHNILLTTQGEFDNGTDTTIEYDSDPDSADGSDFSIQQHTGAEDRSHPDAKDKGSQDFLLDIKASNSIHRKLVLLSIVDHLILEDWQAGKAVAKMIKLKSQDTLKPFCNVTTLSIGLDFLRPNGTLPSPNTSAWDEMTSVLMILAKLQLKHCCANWHALRYYDEEDIYFSILINIWMTQYKLETMTWHGMVQSHHPIPLFGLSNSFLTRHFFKDFERRDQNQIGPSQEQMACECHGRRIIEAQTCAKLGCENWDHDYTIESINLPCLEHKSIKDLQVRYQATTADLSSNQSLSKSKAQHILTRLKEAKPWICCGKK